MNSHNGSAGLDMTFPLWGEFCGYLKVFRGYADSLMITVKSALDLL